MKKQVLSTTMAMTMGLFATMPATAAESVISWTGIVPGTINGPDFGLAAPGGGEIQQGTIIADETGTFTSGQVEVRAYALLTDGSGDIDPATEYDGDIDWSVNTRDINLEEYDESLLKVTLNNQEVTDGEVVATLAGNPNLAIAVSYSDPVVGVMPGERVQASVRLFAEAPAGVI